MGRPAVLPAQPFDKVPHASLDWLATAPTRPDAASGLHATVAQRAPQVMVKVTGGGRGMGAIAAHLRYIAKGGRLPFEDDRGVTRDGKEALHAVVDQWRLGGSRIPEVSDRREAFNIMLSMPAGTKPEFVLLAAREFAKVELANHRYVMVLHTHQANPHVHLAVRAQGRDGKRVNPRKDDLRRWRETFAERLHSWGHLAGCARDAASQRAGLGTQDSAAPRAASDESRAVAEWHSQACPAGLGGDHTSARRVAGRLGPQTGEVDPRLPEAPAGRAGHRSRARTAV